MGSGLRICIKFVKCHSDKGLRLCSFLRPSLLNRQRIALQTRMRVNPQIDEQLLRLKQFLITNTQARPHFYKSFVLNKKYLKIFVICLLL